MSKPESFAIDKAFAKCLDMLLEQAAAQRDRDRIYVLRHRLEKGLVSKKKMTEVLRSNGWHVTAPEQWRQKSVPVKKIKVKT